MLKHLELSDGHTKLLALFEIVQGQVAGDFHNADSFTTKSGNGTANLVFNNIGSLTFVAQQSVCADFDVVQE